MEIDLHHGSDSGDGERRGREPARETEQQQRRWPWGRRAAAEGGAAGSEAIDALLCGRPLVTLAFSDMVVGGRPGIARPAAPGPPRPLCSAAAAAAACSHRAHRRVLGPVSLTAGRRAPTSKPPHRQTTNEQMKVEEPLRLEAASPAPAPAGSRAALLATVPPRL